MSDTPTPGPWFVVPDDERVLYDVEGPNHRNAAIGCHLPDARLIVASVNAMLAAAHRLNVDPLALAKELEEGGIEEMQFRAICGGYDCNCVLCRIDRLPKVRTT